ncbi:hypothetical protein fugu_001166 [Takifugu bimaculatus]|uniref:Uncharacterized protein n=1 Tax=Takifugu bimaculatus TaxID=433685 RepID=A0A4Z2CIR6_9TELE|nr:hypothetical protein fugu_001166 [Takifugu bimaculatus]
MECRCDQDGTEDAVPGWWLSSSNVQMGAFTLVGYLLYRFSQTLPALIRWPIRIFCSLTGLSALWGWVSRLMGTLRGVLCTDNNNLSAKGSSISTNGLVSHSQDLPVKEHLSPTAVSEKKASG